MVYSLSSLLEDESDFQGAQTEEEIYSGVEQNFTSSLDAFSVEYIDILKSGFNKAKHLQLNIANKALELLNKNKVQSCGVFRYVTIEERNSFYTPIAIAKLTLFLQNTCTERKRLTNKIPKPMVVAAFNEQSNTYTVCGVPRAKDRQHLKKNPFGRGFKTAALHVNARVSNITFETFLMEIQKDDWSGFITQLHAVLIT